MDIAQLIGEVLTPLVGMFIGSKSFKFVREGERGALLRFGKFRRILEPGFVFVIPFMYEIDRIHVRQNTIGLGHQVITLKDNLAFKVSSTVIYHVTEPYKALYEIDGLHDSIENVALTVMRASLSAYAFEDVRDLKKLNEELVTVLRERTKTWGIEITSFEINDFEPTADTSRVMLAIPQVEKQIEGNKLLLKHLAEVTEEVRKMRDISPLATALVMRGSNAVVPLATEVTVSHVSEHHATNGQSPHS